MRRLLLTTALTCLLAASVIALAQAPITPIDAPTDDAADDPALPRTPRARAAALAGPPTELIVRYNGELIDDEGQPISGVFGITFQLFEAEAGTEAVWSEQRFVAVDLGEYTVDLGSLSTLPPNLTNQRRWLAVEVAGVGELLREPITLRAHSAEPPSVPARIEALTFASLADRAVSADAARIAENAERLGGKTLEEIDRYPELYRQFMELRSQVHAIRNSGGTRVARRTTTTEQTGGPGGAHYRITCPEGQVVVGITGRAGNVVDALGVICAPLEQAR